MVVSLKKYFNNRGEVASFLTVFAMVVIGLGLVIGYNVSQQEEALNTTPFAQEAKQLVTEPVESLPRVCFPFDSSNPDNRSFDPYCLARMLPVDFEPRSRFYSPAAKELMNDFQGPDGRDFTASSNPFMVNIPRTGQPPTTLQFHGGLCIRTDQVSSFANEGWNVYLSPFFVRKYIGENETAEFDVNDANIVDANRIGTATSSDGRIVAANGNTSGFTNTNICNFQKGAATPQRQSDRYPTFFRADFAYARLQQILTNPDKVAEHPDIDGFDTEDCALYVHARRDGNEDIWNIARIPLEDVVGEEAKAQFCPEATPTPSDIPTGTPIPTETPTPTVTPKLYGCFDPTDLTDPGCAEITECERTNAAGEPLKCLQVSVKGGGLARPDGLDVPTAVGDCVPGPGNICRCLPDRCIDEDCTTKPKACDAPPTPTVTEVPTPTPPQVACTYKALAFIEECDADSILPDGSCAPDPANPGRLKANPIDVEELTNQWAPLNNKQRQFGRYFLGGKEASADEVQVLQNTEAVRFEDLVTNLGRVPEIIRDFRFFTNQMLAKGLTYRAWTESKDLAPGVDPLKPGSEIKIGSIPLSSSDKDSEAYKQEQYNNFEDSNVKFYFDKAKYRVTTNGNKIYSCANDLKDVSGGTPPFPPTGTCKEISTDKTDEIHGMPVGCDQEIVYGVTLQKCDFNYDYVFLVDTSSSMTKVEDDDPNEPEPNKLGSVATQLGSYINDIHATTPNSRVAVTYFNSGIGFDVNTTNQVLLDFTTVENSKDQLLNTVRYDSLLRVAHEGTCIRCGLETTKKLIDQRTDTTRRPVVILLSDGNVNEFPGQAGQNFPAQTQQTKNAAETLWNSGKTTLVAIGYGNGGANATPTDRVNWKEIVYEVASLRKDGETRWAYATAPEISPDGVGRALNEVVKEVQQDLNSCEVSDLAYQEYLKASDINKDGIINSIDLLLLYDNYSARGENIPEDVNKDRVVNALDSSIIFQNYGKTVETQPSRGLTTPGQLDTTPTN